MNNEYAKYIQIKYPIPDWEVVSASIPEPLQKKAKIIYDYKRALREVRREKPVMVIKIAAIFNISASAVRQKDNPADFGTVGYNKKQLEAFIDLANLDENEAKRLRQLRRMVSEVMYIRHSDKPLSENVSDLSKTKKSTVKALLGANPQNATAFRSNIHPHNNEDTGRTIKRKPRLIRLPDGSWQHQQRTR